MIRVLTFFSLGAVLGWMGFALLSLLADAQMSALGGLLIGFGCVLGLHGTIALRGMVALLAPFGVMLPALALRHMGVTLGMPIPGFGTVELLVFLIAYIAFLATAMGVIPVDLSAGLCAKAGGGDGSGGLCLWRPEWQLFVAPVAVLGQVGWVMRWGSSNWFDYVLHAVPVTVVVLILILRLLGM